LDVGKGPRDRNGISNLWSCFLSDRAARFLSDEQKRNIFYNNAARFLRLEEKGQDSSTLIWSHDTSRPNLTPHEKIEFESKSVGLALTFPVVFLSVSVLGVNYSASRHEFKEMLDYLKANWPRLDTKQLRSTNQEFLS